MEISYPIAPPVLPPGIKLDRDVMVTMRDGIKIVCDVYRPEKPGRYPTIFSTGAYLKDIQTYPPEMSHSIETGNTFYMVQHGYVRVIGQSRGSGLSQGQYNWYDKVEQQDGYDMIEWIAKQPFCDGNVGMIGDSYYGRMQWLIAGLQPPHLKCIVPWDASMDDYRSRTEGGVSYFRFACMWGADVMWMTMWPGPVDGKLPPTNWFVQLAQNRDDGPFYWERSGITNADKIKCPVLSIVHGSGQLHSRSQLLGYPKVKAPKKMVILPFVGGPTHVVFKRSKPLVDYILRWLDKWLKGIETGIMDEPEIVMFDRATGECRYENEYPLARTKWVKFYLHTNPAGTADKAPWGLISTDPPKKEQPDKYTEPEAYRTAVMGKPVIGYTSEPLKEDLRVMGPLAFTLHGSITTRDTVWFVKLGVITPDGQTSVLTQGQLKASYRQTDPKKSTPGSPYHTFQNPVPAEAGKIYEYQIPLSPVFYTFKKGTKIWIQIDSDDVNVLANLNGVYTAEMLPVPCTNTVYHDQEHPTHMLLPVVPDAPITKPVPPPLANFKFPLGDTAMK
ncbi:MAG: CocE/NonD family hydrolase [Chloroflexota bacterium]